jgi:histone H1/5
MSAPVAATTSSKTKKVAASKPKAKSHPTYLIMTEEAIKQLNEKQGSSRIAILNFIVGTYAIEKKQANNGLKNALKSGVESGAFKTKGVGVTGSFKLGDGLKKEAKKAAAAAKPKTVKPKTVKPKADKPKADKPKAAAKPRAAKPKKVKDAPATAAAAAGTKKRGRPAGGKASAAKPDAES